MAPTMLFAEVAGLILVVHAPAAPSDEEWQSFLDFARRSRLAQSEQRVLVISAGTGPSLQQQRGLNELLAGMTVRVAIVSDSQEAQRAVRMLQMHNRGTMGFANAALSEALNYLDVAPEQQGEVSAAVAEFQSRIAAAQA